MTQESTVRPINMPYEKLPDQGIVPNRAEQIGAEQHKFTVTFYSPSAKPGTLPDFPYAVDGCVLGHTKFTAYVFAACPADAEFHISTYFTVSEVEVVQYGFKGIHEAVLRGTVTKRYIPSGLFSSLFR